jgi:hypothetical protein
MKLPMTIMSTAAVGARIVTLAACSTGSGSGADAATTNLDGRGPITYVPSSARSSLASPPAAVK